MKRQSHCPQDIKEGKVMIETVLDGNDDDKFLNRSYQTVVPGHLLSASFSAYREEARKIIATHASEAAVIIPEDDTAFSINKLALALFVESCKTGNNLEFVVFKVKDLAKKTEAYKPYVALTVAVKYIMRLASEKPKTALKDIASLGYLGLTIKQDYQNDKLFVSLKRQAPVKKLPAENFSEALAAVGIMKAFALTQTDISLEAEIDCSNYDMPLDADIIIEKIINDVMPLID